MANGRKNGNGNGRHQHLSIACWQALKFGFFFSVGGAAAAIVAGLLVKHTAGAVDAVRTTWGQALSAQRTGQVSAAGQTAYTTQQPTTAGAVGSFEA